MSTKSDQSEWPLLRLAADANDTSWLLKLPAVQLQLQLPVEREEKANVQRQPRCRLSYYVPRERSTTVTLKTIKPQNRVHLNTTGLNERALAHSKIFKVEFVTIRS
ncbi:hypothetical protein KPH14_004428 [Odynerus spinipes]|uniref:Uncharacterized protein n=1 Tax=Odynerus spinipes TaxID=1348599 RepID=A0AAD9RYT7_9HYME|nr:hypothetical protein KPH14_004428 [Odynerus spinipes]